MKNLNLTASRTELNKTQSEFSIYVLATNPKELYSLDPSVSTDDIRECQEIDNESCIKINVDFDVLKSESDIRLEGNVFNHSYTTLNEDNSTTYAYADDLDSALFLYTKKYGYSEIDGYFLTQGSEYLVNNCGDECHILLKLSEKLAHPSDLMKSPDIDEDLMLSEDLRGIDWTSRAEDTSPSIPENSTIFISVMTYYTPEFKQEFVHPVQELKSYIAAANQAFRNSEMPIELKYFDCSFEEIDFEEEDVKDIGGLGGKRGLGGLGCSKGGARLGAFTKAKGPTSFLLKSHDIAMLVTKNQCKDSSGMAWLGTSATWYPKDKKCTINCEPGYRPTIPVAWAFGGNPLTFIHEVGHIFGAGHERSDIQSQTMTNENTQYRYGYHMVGSAVLKEDGTEGDGKATIMASSKRPYTNWIPYFSKDMQVPGK